MIRNYISFLLILMIFFEIEGMENAAQKSLQNNNSPVFIQKVTNNSQKTVKMLKSHFFGFIAQSEQEPLITLKPGQTKEWQPPLVMPYSSVHFLAEFHAVTITARGEFEDAPGSGTYNTCLLTYFRPDLIHKKLLKDHIYTLQLVLADREEDGQVRLDTLSIEERPFTT